MLSLQISDNKFAKTFCKSFIYSYICSPQIIGGFYNLFVNNHLCQQFNNEFAKDARLLKSSQNLVRWMLALRSAVFASGCILLPLRNLTPLCVRLHVCAFPMQRRSMPTSLARDTTCRSTQSCLFAVVVSRTFQVYVTTSLEELWILPALRDVLSHVLFTEPRDQSN